MLGNLGSLNIEQGRLGIGREQSEAALAIHRDTGERVEEGQALTNIAMLDQAAGRVEAARSNFAAALAIARDASNRRQEGVVLGCWRALESEKGQLERGAPALRPGARHPSRRRQSSLREGVVLAQLADLLTQQGRDEEARVLLAQGEAHLRAVDETLESGEPAVPARTARARRRRTERARRRSRRPTVAHGRWISTPTRRCGRRSPRCARRSAPGELLLDDVRAGRGRRGATTRCASAGRQERALVRPSAVLRAFPARGRAACVRADGPSRRCSAIRKFVNGSYASVHAVLRDIDASKPQQQPTMLRRHCPR